MDMTKMEKLHDGEHHCALFFSHEFSFLMRREGRLQEEGRWSEDIFTTHEENGAGWGEERRRLGEQRRRKIRRCSRK